MERALKLSGVLKSIRPGAKPRAASQKLLPPLIQRRWMSSLHIQRASHIPGWCDLFFVEKAKNCLIFYYRETKETVIRFILNRPADQSEAQAILDVSKCMVIPKRRVQRIVSEALSGELSSNKPRLIRRKSLYDKLTEKDREDVRLTVSFSYLFHWLSHKHFFLIFTDSQPLQRYQL